MWRSEKAERALFAWGRWRESVVARWRESNAELGNQLLAGLRGEAGHELAKLEFPTSAFLEIYWVCCVLSDYCLDAPATYTNITMPAWVLPLYEPLLGSPKVKEGLRPRPPRVESEAYVLRLARSFVGRAVDDLAPWMPKEHEFRMFLPPHHELWEVLAKHKGRTGMPRIRGRPSIRSDRLAVRSATLYDRSGWSYVGIAKELGLPITCPYDSRQSDTARYLVDRGRRVLAAVFPEERTSGLTE